MQGKWIAGSPPYGYQYNKNTQRLVPYDPEAKVVQMIFNLFLSGVNGREVSFRAIAHHLCRIGIQTPTGLATWCREQVRRILENPVYTGEVRFRITKRKNDGTRVVRKESEHIIVPDAHEPIIDGETWERAQKKIAEKKQKVNRTPLNFSPCELASLCVCVKCGRKMVRQYSIQKYRKKSGELSVYHKEFLWCQTPRCTFVKYRSVESAILSYLQRLQDLDQDTLKHHIVNVIQEKSPTEDQDDHLAENIESRKRKLKGRLDFLFDKFESGVYTDQEFLERKKKIYKEIEDLERYEADHLPSPHRKLKSPQKSCLKISGPSWMPVIFRVMLIHPIHVLWQHDDALDMYLHHLPTSL